ncbi:MAG TPA: PqqD family peptide modification chaperone [Burkholderiales bacterium]|nr:PqqD family peptide modification chaperone [Burkholderiales bacterium]
MSEELYSSSWYRVANLRPRLRGHVRIHRHHYRGERWYVLEDRVSRRMHRFNPPAHFVIGLMDGTRSVQELWDAAIARFGDDAPTQDELIRLLGQLHAADVLQVEVAPDVAELLRRAQTVRRRNLMQKLSPLALRIPLVDPDRWLERRLPWYRPLFGWGGALLWLLVVGTALAVAGTHWRELTEDLTDRVLAPHNLVILFFTFPVVKLAHELGHACATRAWGGEVHDMGVMLLVFMPIPYVDASAASAFRETPRRVVVGAAGMLVETFIASLALFFWLEAEPGLVRAVLYDVMLIAGVSTVLFNGNPLLRFDGYYMLADLLQMPNLRQRGQQYLAHLVEAKCFGVKTPEFEAGERERGWLAAFTIASFVYRTLVMVGIALFVATQYFFLGVLLALWVAGASIVWPLAKAVRYLASSPKLGRRRNRAVAVSAAATAISAVLLFALPLPLWTSAQGVTWAPDYAVVHARTDGFVRRVAAEPGSPVARGRVLIETEDPQLLPKIHALEAQLRLLEVKAQAELAVDRVRREITMEEMKSVRAELALTRERHAELTLFSPADGVFVLDGAQDLPERYLKKGQLVAFVVSPTTATVRVLVSQDDVDLVRSRTHGVEVKLAGRLAETLEATLIREVPAASQRLPNPALSTQGGGLVAIDPRQPDTPTALARWFEFELELPGKPARALGERVYVRFEHGWEPLAWRIGRSVRQLFMKRFAV